VNSPSGDNERITLMQSDLAVVHSDGERSRQDKKELVCLGMAVWAELASNLGQPNVVII
jgi:hypothetical protein